MDDIQPIRVVIADDQAIVRKGLAAIMTAYKQLQLVGEAENGAEAIELCELVQPDIVLMDLKMPFVDGIAATRTITQRWSQIHVLVLTSYIDQEMVQSALDAGARGYLLKNLTAKQLVEAILQVHQGKQRLSREAAHSLFQAEHLRRLREELSGSEVDLTRFVEALNKRIPKIFPGYQVQVRLYPDQDIFSFPTQPSDPLPAPAWDWLWSNRKSRIFQQGDEYPWGGSHFAANRMILAPIPGLSDNSSFGGIRLVEPNEVEESEDPLTIVHSLVEVMTSALGRDQEHLRRLEHRRTIDELEWAGRVQSRILPEKPPYLPGWELVAKLIPARQTTGDFFDFIALPNGKWGIIMADVTDKGLGAAVFMAMCSSLFRTYAARFPTLPAITMRSVNERIFTDMRGGLFATAFYGILEPEIGRMRYVNAGHNPPYLLSTKTSKPVDKIERTGIALGVSEEAYWEQRVLKFSPGDILVLYTDGITEAQDSQGAFFGEQRLLETIRAPRSRSAQDILENVIGEVRQFAASRIEMDDIALIVLSKKT